jgi:hypothetical protein
LLLAYLHTLAGTVRFHSTLNNMNAAAQIARKASSGQPAARRISVAHNSTPGTETAYKPHRFNPAIAKVYSLPAALVFHYIWLRCGCRSGTFVALSLDEIAANYPYLSRTTVYEAIKLLVIPGNNPGIVSRKIIKGVRYYGIIPKDKYYLDFLFDVRSAIELGLVPAIILASIGYWVKANWKRKSDDVLRTLYPEVIPDYRQAFEEALVRTLRGAVHTTTIEDWLERHSYISERTARRGFSCLLQAGHLEKRPGKQHKTIYTLSTDLLAKYANNLLSLSEIKNSAAKSEQRPAKSEQIAAKSEEESGLTDAPTASYDTHVEVHDEAFLSYTCDAFGYPSLAGARFGVARSASTGGFALRAAEAKAHQLDRPDYARPKKRSRKKRSYSRVKPIPPPADVFDPRVEDMSKEEREKFFDSLRAKGNGTGSSTAFGS